jgi:hypothetical protein
MSCLKFVPKFSAANIVCGVVVMAIAFSPIMPCPNIGKTRTSHPVVKTNVTPLVYFHAYFSLYCNEGIRFVLWLVGFAPTPRKQLLRSRFRKFDFDVYKPSNPPAKGRPHPLNCRLRDCLSKSIDSFIQQSNYIPYSISMSVLEQSQNCQGSRLHYHSTDLMMHRQSDPVLPNHVLKMVDVDYYADLPYWLSFMRPLVIGTFTPMYPSGPLAEGVYTTNLDGTITMSMDTGTSFTHKLLVRAEDHGLAKNMELKLTADQPLALAA